MDRHGAWRIGGSHTQRRCAVLSAAFSYRRTDGHDPYAGHLWLRGLLLPRRPAARGLLARSSPYDVLRCSPGVGALRGWHQGQARRSYGCKSEDCRGRTGCKREVHRRGKRWASAKRRAGSSIQGGRQGRLFEDPRSARARSLPPLCVGRGTHPGIIPRVLLVHRHYGHRAIRPVRRQRPDHHQSSGQEPLWHGGSGSERRRSQDR